MPTYTPEFRMAGPDKESLTIFSCDYCGSLVMAHDDDGFDQHELWHDAVFKIASTAAQADINAGIFTNKLGNISWK